MYVNDVVALDLKFNVVSTVFKEDLQVYDAGADI